MKRTLILMMVSLMLLACGEKSNAVTVKEQSGKVKDFVEVLYFHGKQRCVTCRSIEQNTKELLESKFQRQMKEGKVVYRVIDISKTENTQIAEMYEVTWSSLFLVQHKNGKEKAENLTEFAFGHSRTQPEVFKKGLAEKINQALK
ncbi:MAG: thioredoxin [Prevotella sp.]|nr:thioredoxin [Prevotella sp.]